MGDTLHHILDGVGKVVHGIDAPLVALAVVMHMTDAVDNGVTHIEIAGGQVDLGTEGIAVVLELTGAHTGEHLKVAE